MEDNYSSEETTLLQYALQLDAVRQIGLELTAELDLEILLNSILVHAANLLEGGLGGLYLYQPESNLLQLAAGLDTFNVPIGTNLKIGEGLAGQVWQTGKTITVDNYQNWENRSKKWANVVGEAAVIGTPIRWRREMTGVIILANRSGKTYTRTDVELLRLLAAQAAVAIQNARMITQRKIAEEKLRAYAQELERSNQELQDFAQIASHDLKEPLRKIMIFTDRLLQRDESTFTDREFLYLSRMRESCARMQKLITDLLTLANVRGQPNQFEKVDLDQILQDTITDLENQIETVNGRINIITPLPVIDAIPTQMRQLFQNLLSNALKFHKPKQPPLINIDVTQLPLTEDGQNPQYQLTIEDNGIGFEEKYKNKIFNVLQRLHGREQYEGSGIGLAVCQRIVERHNGALDVHSQPGKGATFFVTLPKHSLVDISNNHNETDV